MLVQGVEIFVKEQGQGQPSLFLHGVPDSADMWDPLVVRLSPYIRCITPDLPGFARSALPPSFDASLDGLADYVDTLVAALGITEPLDLVLHDFGGIFGLAWTVKHPEKVRSLVIMNTVFCADYHWHRWATIWRTPLLGDLSMLFMNRWVFARSLRSGGPLLSDQQIKAAYAHVSGPMKRTILKLYRATDVKNFRGWEEKLVQIAGEKPSLVLWGDDDPYLPRWLPDRFGAQRVKHFQDYGHWLPATNPAEVARAMLKFYGIAEDRPTAAAAPV